VIIEAHDVEPDHLTVPALAKKAGVSVRTVWYWIGDPLDPLTHYQRGRRVTVRIKDFEAWDSRRHQRVGSSLEERIERNRQKISRRSALPVSPRLARRLRATG